MCVMWHMTCSMLTTQNEQHKEFGKRNEKHTFTEQSEISTALLLKKSLLQLKYTVWKNVNFTQSMIAIIIYKIFDVQ